MLSLILATVFSSGFALIVRYAQGRRCNMWAVGALNYTCAALYNLTLAATRGSMVPSPSTWWIGLSGGVSYVVAYFTLFKFMALRGVAISTAVMRLSVLIPVVASVAIWGDRPNTYQVVGCLLAVASLPLLGVKPGASRSGVDRQAGVYLALLFALNGYNLLVMRMFEETGRPAESALYLGILFGVAAVVAVAGWYLHREGTTKRDVSPGIGLGLVNAFGNLSLVAALGALPGFLVYPFHSAVGLAITVIAARLIWRERGARSETAGILVSLAAAVLINLR